MSERHTGIPYTGLRQEDRTDAGRPLTLEEVELYLSEGWESGEIGWQVEDLQAVLNGMGANISVEEDGIFGPDTKRALNDALSSGGSVPQGWMQHAFDSGYSDPRVITTHGAGQRHENFSDKPSDIIGMDMSPDEMKKRLPSIQGSHYDPQSPESMGKYKEALSALAESPESAPGQIDLPQSGKEVIAKTAKVDPATRSAAKAALAKLLGGAAPEGGPLLKKKQAAAVAAQRLSGGGPDIEGMGGVIEDIQAQDEAFPDDPSQAEWSRGHDFSGGEATMGQLAKAPRPMPEQDPLSDQNFTEATVLAERWGDTLSSGADSGEIRDQTDIVDMLVARRKPDSPVYNQIREDVSGSGDYPDYDPKVKNVSMGDEDPKTKIDPLPADFDPTTTFNDEVGDTFANADPVGMANIRNAMATAASDKKEEDFFAESMREISNIKQNMSLEEEYGETHPEELERVRLHEGLKDGDKIREKYLEFGPLGEYLTDQQNIKESKELTSEMYKEDLEKPLSQIYKEEGVERRPQLSPEALSRQTAAGIASDFDGDGVSDKDEWDAALKHTAGEYSKGGVGDPISAKAKEQGQAVANSMLDELTQGADLEIMMPALKRFESDIASFGQRGTARDRLEAAIKGASSAQQLHALDPSIRNAITDEQQSKMVKGFAGYFGDATSAARAAGKVGRGKAKIKMGLDASAKKEVREMEKARRQKQKDIRAVEKMAKDDEISELKRQRLSKELEKMQLDLDNYDEHFQLKMKNLRAGIASKNRANRNTAGGSGAKANAKAVAKHYSNAKHLQRTASQDSVMAGTEVMDYRKDHPDGGGEHRFTSDLMKHINAINAINSQTVITTADVADAKEHNDAIIMMFEQIRRK